MAKITLITEINYPDDKATEVRDLLAPYFGWTAQSPQTKAQYIADYLKNESDRYMREFVRESFRRAKEIGNDLTVT